MNKSIMNELSILIKHELKLTLRNPFWVFFGLFQPVVYLVLFAPFLNGLAGSSGFPGSAIQFFAPGLLIMNAVMNAGYAGFGLLDKLSSGFIERIRVLPISRISIVLGFVLDVSITLIFQSILLLLVSLAFGLQINVAGFSVLMLLLLIIGVFMASCSFSLSLIINDGGALASAVSFFTMPLLLLSGIMLPLSFAPRWIQLIAKANPFYYAVDAARALINGTIYDSSVIAAFGLFGIVAIIALWWFASMMHDAVS